tara:strand:- start:555 stop:824 length:270 start_codon:yes stop_codon:yes gene_type:complete
MSEFLFGDPKPKKKAAKKVKVDFCAPVDKFYLTVGLYRCSKIKGGWQVTKKIQADDSEWSDVQQCVRNTRGEAETIVCVLNKSDAEENA